MYQRIEALCLQNGTNVTAMCRQLGISRSSLTELKTGRTKSLSFEALSAIAKYFGTTPDYLAGTANDTPAGELDGYLEELRTRPEMRMFFDLAKDASKSDVEAAVKIVEAYLKGREGAADE